MTTIPTAIRFVRLSFAVSLLGGGLLLGSAHASVAAEIAPTAISASIPQAQGAGQATSETAPTPDKPLQINLPPAGVVGFGWG